MDTMASNASPARLRLVHGSQAEPGPELLGPVGALSDAQLVALVCQRDARAFEVLYRRHAPFAVNLAVRIQGSAVDVEDIVHDAFLKAHARVGELREGQAFRSWLGAIVVRLVRTRLRRHRLLSGLGLGTAEPVELEAVASSDAGPEARALLAQIYALLKTIPADDRIAWTLRYIERHRLEMVAELTSCSLATAKRRIQRAQRFLNTHFVAPFAEEASA